MLSYQISTILKIPSDQRTPVQNEILKFSPEVVLRCKQNKAKRDLSKARLEEVKHFSSPYLCSVI